MTEKTLFEKIVDREIPADIVYEDDLCLAFRDISPQAPTHVLLIPKKPLINVQHATHDDAALLGHLMTQIPLITKQLGVSEAYRLVINNGEGAGQTVFHLHIHILAGRSLDWPPG